MLEFMELREIDDMNTFLHYVDVVKVACFLRIPLKYHYTVIYTLPDRYIHNKRLSDNN